MLNDKLVIYEGDFVLWHDQEWEVKFGNYYVTIEKCIISLPIIGWFLYSHASWKYYPLSDSLYLTKKDRQNVRVD